MPEEAVKKLTVAAAATACGVPERSLFRAVEKGQVPSTKKDGVTVVDPADVAAWGARRAAAQGASAPATAAAASPNGSAAAVSGGTLPAAHGGSAGGGGRPPGRPVLDGELTAQLVAAFKRGEEPVDVAERLRLPIPLVLEGHDHFLRAKAATTPTPQQALIDELQFASQMAAADINSLMETVGRLNRDLAALSTRVGNLPVPDRGAFICTCGNAGWVATPMKCTACGRTADWGFHPDGK